MPFFRGAKNWRRAVLGGWQLNGILSLQTGLPFSVTAGTDRSLAGVGLDRADVTGVAHTFNSSDRSAKIQKFFDTSVFSLPGLGTFGTSSRNFLFGPGIENFDAGLFKRFALTERKQFELRWEVFNSLNRPNFLNPVAAFTNPRDEQVADRAFTMVPHAKIFLKPSAAASPVYQAGVSYRYRRSTPLAGRGVPPHGP